MKNTFMFIICLFIILSCGNNSTTQSNAVAIPSQVSGLITNPTAPNIILSNGIDNINIMIQDGAFQSTVDLKTAAIYTLQYGREQATIFLAPGKDLKILANGRGFTQNLKFEGVLASENDHLVKKSLEQRKSQALKIKDYKLAETEFIQTVDARKVSDQADLQLVARKNNFNPVYTKLMETEIYYEWATDRIIYPDYHIFYTKDDNFEISDSYDDYMKELQYDDGSLLASNHFKSFITKLIEVKTKAILDIDSTIQLKDNGLVKTRFDVIKANFKASEIIDFLMYQSLKQHIQYEGANGTPEMIAIFNESCTNQSFKKDIQNDFANWANLVAGTSAPTFNYADLNGKKFSLEDFSGKYVYIDVWATWCGPCRREFPYLEELQEKYKGNDKIVFTSISIDQDTEAWRKMVTEKNMQGVQLLADGAWQSKIVADYKISGIPRFLLIGPDGNILSAHAPRPSSEKIKAKLASYLEG